MGAPPPEAPTARAWPLGLGSLAPGLRRYVLLVAGAGAICQGMALTLVLLDDEPLALHFLVILALFVATGLMRGIELRRGSKYVRYRVWEFPALLGVVVGPFYLVPLTALLVRTVELTRDFFDNPGRRHKLPFEFGQISTTMFVCAALAAAGAPPLSYIVAGLVTGLLSEALWYRYDVLAGDPQAGETLRRTWHIRLGVPVAVAAACSLLLLVPGGGRLILALVPAALLLVYKGVSEFLLIGHDRDQWRRLDAVSSALVGEFDEHAIIRTAMVNGLDMFTASSAELTLVGPGSGGFTYTLTDRVGDQITATPFAEEPKHDSDTDPASQRTVTVPLNAGGQHLGHLRLHFDSRRPRNTERQQLLNTFAHSVAANLMAARAHEEVRRQAEAKTFEATHDTLTGLGNRVLLYERGPVVLANAAAVERPCALLLLDLDGFKRINDTLGHATGDQVLVQIGRSLRQAIRRSDLAVRLGGDEFAVLATDLGHPADALLLAAKVQRALMRPLQVEGLQLTVEASIGIAIHPHDAEDVDNLLKLADIAMYEAKARGRGQAFRYSSSADTHTTEALSLATDLRQAIGRERHELTLYYQPQVNLRTGTITGMEALVRWNHPGHGLLLPDQFVHIAEHSGLIRQFTLSILSQAIEDRAAIRPLLPHATVSVNLSARNLMDQGLPTDVATALERYGVSGSELVLEITETFARQEDVAAESVLTNLRAMGCQIALDDFGTGYSTLDALHRDTPIDEIKIDRAFVATILTDPAGEVIVQSIIQMAHARGCRVVAEGVEDGELMYRLREMGCDLAQGYHIMRPAPLDQVRSWVGERATWDTSTLFGVKNVDVDDPR